MFGRGMSVLLAAALLSGCVSDRTGFDYAAVVQKVGSPRPGQSRIVLISEKASGLDSAVCDVKIDGGPESKLRPGTYVYVDQAAGRHEIVATQMLFPGETRRELATQAGRTYFFLARNSERSRAITGVTVFGGLAGMAVASAVTSGSKNPGPVDLYPLEEMAARATLAQLQLAE